MRSAVEIVIVEPQPQVPGGDTLGLQTQHDVKNSSMTRIKNLRTMYLTVSQASELLRSINDALGSARKQSQ